MQDGGDAADGDGIRQMVRDIEMILCQMDRAKDLLAGLNPYKVEWTQATQVLDGSIDSCPMNAAIAAAVMIFAADMKEVRRASQYQNLIDLNLDCFLKTDRVKMFNQRQDECLNMEDVVSIRMNK